MENEKLSFVNEKLRWGYLADTTGHYNGVFEPPLAEWPTLTEEKWPKEMSIVEVLNRDIRGLTHKDWPGFIEKIKKYNVKITAHDSFMRNDFYDEETDKSTVNAKKFFADKSIAKEGNIVNLFWYVVPASYTGAFPVYQKSVEQGREDIDFAADCGSDRMTMHVTKFGLRLNPEEFKEYVNCWSRLDAYGKERGVKLLVETGGVSEEQLMALKEMGANFNLDTAHVLLDKMEALSLYEKIKDHIGEVHLSMTKGDQDYHEGINYTGDGYSPELRKINAEMVRRVSERQKAGEDITLILEVAPSFENVDFLYAALKGEA